jgi:hypothetical protein
MTEEITDDLISELYDGLVEPMLLLDPRKTSVPVHERIAVKAQLRMNRPLMLTLLKCCHDLCHKHGIKGYLEA